MKQVDVTAVEKVEARAHRSDPRFGTILAEARVRYEELAAQAPDGPSRIALLADVVRLTDAGDTDEPAEAFAEAATPQRAILAWLARPHAAESARLRWLAHANLVDLLAQSRLARTGMPRPAAEDEAAMRGAVAAAHELEEAYPRLLSLHLLAAALWERDAIDTLEPVLDTLDALEPHAWRRALGRAHVAIARGRHDDAVHALEETRRAKPPADLSSYVRRLEGSLAAARGDLKTAHEKFTLARRTASIGVAAAEALDTLATDPGRLPPTRALITWDHPGFVFDEAPRYELAIELWRHLPGGRAHARFVATRLAAYDPDARWRHWQAQELGVPAGRTHQALLAELLAPTPRRVRHPRFGAGLVVRELEGKTEVEFEGVGRKVLVSSVLQAVDDGDDDGAASQ